MVEVLLKQPLLDINRSASNGTRAAHCACVNDNVTGLRMLLRDPMLISANKRGPEGGQSPLMMAVVRGSVDCVREMVRVEGVDLDEGRDRKGKSLEEVARWVKCTALLGTINMPIGKGAKKPLNP